jgi:hypothetical protein
MGWVRRTLFAVAALALALLAGGIVEATPAQTEAGIVMVHAIDGPPEDPCGIADGSGMHDPLPPEPPDNPDPDCPTPGA